MFHHYQIVLNFQYFNTFFITLTLCTTLDKFIIAMQDHIFYRIISNTKPKQSSHLTTSNDFHHSIPLKLTHKKQEASSLAYLSSLMQTENLLMKKITPSQTGQTTRQPSAFLTEKAASLPQTGKKQKTEREYSKKSHWIDMLTQTRKRLLKKENALLNIVGEYDPEENLRRENKSMEKTIYKARTFTMIPTTSHLPAYKKRQNHLKLKEQFTNFIKKQDWKAEVDRAKLRQKIQTEPVVTQYAKTQKASSTNAVPDKETPFRFLKVENPRRKRLRTQQPPHHYAQISKKMTSLLLKSELKANEEPFNLTRVDKRKSFKLKTDL